MYTTLRSPAKGVAVVELNRPEKRNAMNALMWDEVGEYFTKVREPASVARFQ